jgi:hypothetical protein
MMITRREMCTLLPGLFGFSSWSVAEGSASGGLLARSESAVAPGYDRAVGKLYAVWVSDYW